MAQKALVSLFRSGTLKLLPDNTPSRQTGFFRSLSQPGC